MSSKHLLVETSRNPFARELLRSADLDEPPPHSAMRLGIALGLGSSALLSTIATGAAATTEATVGAAVATAKGLAAAGTAAPTAAASVSASVATSTAVLSSAVGSANVLTGTAALSGAATVSAASAAAPVVTGALSAMGMLKAMAVVSLTCGALSFGGTKLAITITDASAPVAKSRSLPERTTAVEATRMTSRAMIALSRTDEPAPPPPAPDPALQGEDDEDDEALPALEQEPRRADALTVATLQAASGQDRRQDIEQGAAAHAHEQTSGSVLPDFAAAAGDAPVRRAAVAAFPSDDEPAAPSLNAQPGRKPKLRLKAPKVNADAEALEREILLLDRARSAVAAGQPLVALQALDAYRTQPHRGTLRAESFVLRVKALLALGQRTAAEREAMPFIKAAPQSTQAARLRELIGVPNDTP